MWSVGRPCFQSTSGKLGVKGGLPCRFEPVPRLCVLLTDGGVVPHEHCLRQVGSNRTDARTGVSGDGALLEIQISVCTGVPGKEVIHVERFLLARGGGGGVLLGGCGVAGGDVGAGCGPAARIAPAVRIGPAARVAPAALVGGGSRGGGGGGAAAIPL